MDQQLDTARGFSVHSEHSLDLRMDPTEPGSITGEVLLNEHLEKDLHRVFAPIERRREARAVVRAIIKERKRHRIETAAQLADLIAATITRGGPRRRIDAAPYMMCLRAEVNAESKELEAGVEAAVSLLTADGRAALCILSWHGQEHHDAKLALRRLQHPCICPPDLPLCSCGRKPSVRIITPKPLSPDEEEVQSNPAARSARLSIAVKLAAEDDGPGPPNDTAPIGRGPREHHPERRRRG
jgi:16S rRNA (cytosine1402-N4)-methyltransferase